MPNVSPGEMTVPSLVCVFAAAIAVSSSGGARTPAPTPSASPCRSSPEYRALDFWIGDWEVETAQGKSAGKSRIELLLDQCIVFENWTGDNGYEGKSFNLFDRSTGTWAQTWVDNVGQITRFDGEARDGNLYYRTEVKDGEGRPALRRMTFFPQGPDRVRQLGERSLDGGSTWSVDYDLIYKRRKEK
jgi:hypothetical protein